MDNNLKYILYFKNGKSVNLNQDASNTLASALDRGSKFITFRDSNDDVKSIINVAEISHLTNIL